MTAQPNEGNLEGAGGTNANSSPSTPDTQPYEASLSEMKASLDRALKKLDAQDGEIRALKSGKDKAVDRALGEITPLKETLAKVAKHLGVDESEVLRAQRELILDELVTERMGGNRQSATVSPGKDTQPDTSAELRYIDEGLELPSNDPRVTELKLKYSGKPADYLREAAKLKGTINQPTPAEQLPPAGGQPPKQLDAEQLKQNYINDMRAARGKPAQLRDIKNKYTKLGVNVHEVDFT